MPGKRIPRRTLSAIQETRWAMTPDQLETMIAIANREDLGALAASRPEYLQDDDADAVLKVYNEGRTAVIEVVGACFRYANLFTEFCGGAVYEDLALQLAVAEETQQIENAVLLLDTPGGMVTGCAEWVGMIEKFSKPIVAYVDGDACSAGYWMGAACDYIVASRTSQLGCLGVVAVYTDNKKQLEMEGLREYELVSTLTPNKRPDVTSSDGRAEIMRSIDDTAEIFLGDVARFRGFKGGAKGVAKATNGGGIYVGQKAVDIGLADEIGTFADVIETLAPAKKSLSRAV
ncbi:S49 family peptidase [Devosia faecipullorum]|uniref:S49 family peptidase n=1 Tax=Devosia faecipullorum TaxID=2755039 RepID=UPI00187BC350|nr:S49 family peptidase [Devosia faecipullorum]MBE7732165.1 S49 family peptidase [Devosia faecipullorum]